MTKLMQWLFGLFLFLGVWSGLVADVLKINIPQPYFQVLLYLPIYLLMTFACYSLGVIGYRVATFNDCVEAADELQQQIAEAKKDLKKKGMKL